MFKNLYDNYRKSIITLVLIFIEILIAIFNKNIYEMIVGIILFVIFGIISLQKKIIYNDIVCIAKQYLDCSPIVYLPIKHYKFVRFKNKYTIIFSIGDRELYISVYNIKYSDEPSHLEPVYRADGTLYDINVYIQNKEKRAHF